MSSNFMVGGTNRPRAAPASRILAASRAEVFLQAPAARDDERTTAATAPNGAAPE
jgi:hypothetical protein